MAVSTKVLQEGARGRRRGRRGWSSGCWLVLVLVGMACLLASSSGFGRSGSTGTKEYFLRWATLCGVQGGVGV